MNKKLSPMGYAIAFILLVAFIMLVSSPVLIKNYKNTIQTSPDTPPIPADTYTPNDRGRDFNSADKASGSNDIAELERRLNDRLDEIERSGSNRNHYENSISDKYICSIEGGLNEDGVVVPIDPNNPPAKFVFACEYRQ